MSYFRSYFQKNNTIIKNSQTNTAKNPTTEIFYGSGFSKFIFRVDFTDLKQKIQNIELVIDSNTRHTLHLTNTIFGDESLLGLDNSRGRDRATSFDLILFKIPNDQFWDEGIGFDYQNESYDFVDGNKTYDERPSNWFYRNTISTWSTSGIYNEFPSIISGYTGGKIHFDNGNEDINFDITDYVNNILISGATDQGMGIAFDNIYAQLNPTVDQSVSFFTKYTQTFYEPYVESTFDDNIFDNRDNFTAGIPQSLYLFVSQNGSYINLDQNPIVDIQDSNKLIIPSLSGLTTTQVRKGVYKVDFILSGLTCDDKRFFYDNWKNISVSGTSLENVLQKFIPKSVANNFKIGGDVNDFNRYAMQYYGIKLNEKIQTTEKRKIVVNFRDINNPRNVVLDNVYYKIWIEESPNTQVIVHDWTLMDKTNENSFILNTTYFIPREYYMQFKAEINNEEIIYKDTIYFTIVSQK
jgi:hypothetical protein